MSDFSLRLLAIGASLLISAASSASAQTLTAPDMCNIRPTTPNSIPISQLTCSVQYDIVPTDGREPGRGEASFPRMCALKVSFVSATTGTKVTRTGTCLIRRGEHSCKVNPALFKNLATWYPCKAEVVPSVTLIERHVLQCVIPQGYLQATQRFLLTACSLDDLVDNQCQPTYQLDGTLPLFCRKGRVVKTYREIFEEIAKQL